MEANPVSMNEKHFLFLISKYPSSKWSKTRLQGGDGGLSPDAASDFCSSSIIDLILRFSNFIGVRKIIYCPENHKDMFMQWLNEFDSNGTMAKGFVLNDWEIVSFPAIDPSNGVNSVPMLTHVLSSAIDFALSDSSAAISIHRICFIGMDTPHLPLHVVQESLFFPLHDKFGSYMVPSKDGGYNLLTIAIQNRISNSKAYFDQVEWSTPNAFATQRRALENLDMKVAIPKDVSFVDVDEPVDLILLLEEIEISSRLGGSVELGPCTRQWYQKYVFHNPYFARILWESCSKMRCGKSF